MHIGAPLRWNSFVLETFLVVLFLVIRGWNRWNTVELFHNNFEIFSVHKTLVWNTSVAVCSLTNRSFGTL